MNILENLHIIKDKALKMGFDDCLVSGTSMKTKTILVRNLKNELYNDCEVNSFSTQVWKDSKTTFLSFNSMNAVNDVLQDALEGMSALEPDPLNLPWKQESLQIKDDYGCMNVDLNNDYLVHLESLAYKIPKITKSEGNSESFSKATTAFVSSWGIETSGSGSSHSFSFSFIAEDNGKKQQEAGLRVARSIDGLGNLETWVRHLAQKAADRLNVIKIATGEYPIVLEPGAATGLLSAFLRALNGNLIAEKSSVLADKLGVQIFNKDVYITEDPLSPFGYSRSLIDNQGVLTKRKYLVQEGRLQGFLLDLRNARKMHLDPTGNGSAMMANNPLINPGFYSQDYFVNMAPKVLVITDLMGSGVNVTSGELSQGARGFLYENGQKVGAVEQITIAGNLLGMWQDLQVASNLDLRIGSFSPSLFLPKVMVAAGG